MFRRAPAAIVIESTPLVVCFGCFFKKYCRVELVSTPTNGPEQKHFGTTVYQGAYGTATSAYPTIIC